MKQEFVNTGEHGRIIIVTQDGPTVVLSPGETREVWTYKGKFYHHEQTRRRRLVRWCREVSSGLFGKRKAVKRCP